jgi:endonuclease-8
MPEGDTIFRSAETLRRWLAGREITSASTPGRRRVDVDATVLVGATVTGVESRAKHLLVHFDSGLVLHTHMRMTGSWHVYPAGERWRKPAWQARLVLEAGDRVAVCFNAPVVELRSPAALRADPSLSRLGPDVLATAPVDPVELARRVRARAARCVTLGELLLDQQVVSGIGNIYRCESLFLCGIDPHTPTTAAAPALVERLVSTASRLMAANAKGSAAARAFDALPDRPWVYKRSGRPCRRCGATVVREVFGDQARALYWCPGCQLEGHPAEPPG